MSGTDTIYGDAGDDTIITRAGNDIVDGGDGSDTLNYSEIDNDTNIGNIFRIKLTNRN